MTFPNNATNVTQPPAQPGQADGSGGTAQPSSVPTMDQITQLLNERDKQLTDKLAAWYKGMQRQSQGVQDAVEKRVQEAFARAQAAGIQLTDQQRESIQANSLAQVLTDGGQPDKPAVPQVQAPTEEPDPDVANTNAAAKALQKALGVEITDTDPEADSVAAAIAAGATPEQYLDAMYKAITAKKARLADQAAPQNASPGFVSGSTSNPLHDKIVPVDDLWDMMVKKGEV